MSNAQRDHLSIREFVALSGLSASTIRRRIADGSLPSVQLGGAGKKHQISADALERFAKPAGGAQSAGNVAADASPAEPPPSGTGPAAKPPSQRARHGPKPGWFRQPSTTPFLT